MHPFHVLLAGFLSCALVAVAPSEARPQAPEAAAAAFLAALRTGDDRDLAQHFADTVRFEGEVRIVGDWRDGRAVLPATARKVAPARAGGSNHVAVELSAADLAAGYARVVAGVTPARWQAMLERVQPTLTRVTADGEHVPFTKAGDYVYDLHLREAIKGHRSGLDEALLFVFRNVGDRHVIVAHWGDL